jgi:hypothetical protein
LRPAKLFSDSILLRQMMFESLLLIILVKIFLLVSIREMGRVSASSCDQIIFFGRRVTAECFQWGGGLLEVMILLKSDFI